MRHQSIFEIARPIARRECCFCFSLAMLAAGLSSLVTTGALAALTTTSVSYTGPNNGLWNSAGNWSTGSVPANSGTNQFTVTIAGNAVVFNLAGSTTINDLILSNALQLNANCNLAVANQLSLSGASITANGGNFTADGPPATATNLNVNASTGRRSACRPSRRFPRAATIHFSPAGRAACWTSPR